MSGLMVPLPSWGRMSILADVALDVRALISANPESRDSRLSIPWIISRNAVVHAPVGKWANHLVVAGHARPDFQGGATADRVRNHSLTVAARLACSSIPEGYRAARVK